MMCLYQCIDQLIDDYNVKNPHTNASFNKINQEQVDGTLTCRVGDVDLYLFSHVTLAGCTDISPHSYQDLACTYSEYKPRLNTTNYGSQETT